MTQNDPTIIDRLAEADKGEPVAWRYRTHPSNDFHPMHVECGIYQGQTVEVITHPDPRIEYAYLHPPPPIAAAQGEGK